MHERASPSSAKDFLAPADAVLSPVLVPLSPPSHCCMQAQGTVVVILSSATGNTLDLELFLKEISAHQDNLNSFRTSILFALKIDFFFFFFKYKISVGTMQELELKQPLIWRNLGILNIFAKCSFGQDRILHQTCPCQRDLIYLFKP